MEEVTKTFDWNLKKPAKYKQRNRLKSCHFLDESDANKTSFFPDFLARAFTSGSIANFLNSSPFLLSHVCYAISFESFKRNWCGKNGAFFNKTKAQSTCDIPYLNRKIFLFHCQIFKSDFFLSLTFPISLSDFYLIGL